MFAALLLLLLRMILRKTWLAAAVLVALVAAFAGPVVGLYAIPFVWVMIRYGVLPSALTLVVAAETNNWPLTSDLSAWYADKGLIVVALLVALAAWAFRNALAGRKVLQGDLL